LAGAFAKAAPAKNTITLTTLSSLFMIPLSKPMI
jgi:hypothetical protein